MWPMYGDSGSTAYIQQYSGPRARVVGASIRTIARTQPATTRTSRTAPKVG
jgi:hypothetical protein